MRRWQVPICSTGLLIALAVWINVQGSLAFAQETKGEEEIFVLEEVKVRAPGYQAPRPDFPGTFNVIPKEEIERTHPSHVGEVLRRVPGVTYQDEDGRGFRPDIGIRGLDPLRSRNVLILVDGIPIQPSVYGDPAAYYNVPVQRLERIEVIKGGSAILYGTNTVGGVINYITKPPPDKPIEVSARESFGSHAEFINEASVGGIHGRLGYFGSYTRRQGNGFRENDEFTVNDGTVRLEGNLGEGSHLTFNFNYYDEFSETPGGLLPKQFRENFRQTQFPNDEFESVRASADMTFRQDLGPYGAIRATLYGNFFERNWFIALTSAVQNDQFRRKFDVLGFEPQYQLGYSVLGMEGNQLTLGLRFHFDRETDRRVRGRSPTARSGRTLENVELETDAFAFYLQNEFSLTDRLKVTPGFRYERVKLSRDDFVREKDDSSTNRTLIPAVGVSYRLADETYLFGSFQKSFKPPEFREAIDPTTGTDTDLPAQKSTNYEVGIRSTPLDWLSIETSAFLFNFENQIVREAGRLVAAQDTRHKGIEGTVSLGLTRFLKGPLGLALPDWAGDLSFYYSFTLLNAEFTNGSFERNELPAAPKQQRYWSIRYTHPVGLSASLDGLFVDEQFADQANTKVENATGTVGLIPSYAVWDLNLDYRLTDWLSAFFSVKNLFDEIYFTQRSDFFTGIVPAPDRTFHGGIEIRF